MKLSTENLGIVAGAVAVAYLLYKAMQTGNAMQSLAGVNTDGQLYRKTYQNDPVLSEDRGLTWT